MLSVDLQELLSMLGVDPINAAIQKVTGFPTPCPGPVFPVVHRGWMTWPPFEGM